MGRPPVLSREALVDAALAEGLDTLTMASVARRLGVVKSALYRWVSGREELLGLVSDVVVERLLPVEGPADWRDWLVDLAHRMRREFLAVPGYAARIAGPHEHHSDAHERLLRTVHGRLVAGGLDETAARDVGRLWLTAVVGWLAAESHWSDAPDLFERFVTALVRGLPG
jgi:AcrR family transcriptional regulator